MNSAGSKGEASLLATVRALYASLSRSRQRQFRYALGLMLLGAIAELLTIGAVLPVLALIADPATAADRAGYGLFLALVGGEPGQDLVWAGTMLLAVAAILSAVLRLVILHEIERFAFMVGHDLAAIIFGRMIRQPYRLYVERNPAELLAAIGKIESLISYCLLPLMHGLIAVVIAPAIILLMVVIAPAPAAMAASAVILVYLGMSLAMGGRLRANAQTIAHAASARMKAVQEGLGALRDILLEHSQEVFDRRFERLDQAFREAQISNAFVSAAPRYTVEAAGVIAIGLLALHMSGQPGGILAAIPVLGMLALGAQRLLPLLQIAYVGWSRFNGNQQIVRDVVALIYAPVVAVDRVREPHPFERDIVFDGVSLEFSGGEQAVRGISLRIEKGERVGLVGRTGSGKSSFLDLFMGLLKPTAGEILIDGRRLDDESRPNWQAQIAHVPQAIYLADDPIAANIAFGEADSEIDMARVHEAARRAQIDDFIEQCPRGYNTHVGERGIRLSGGQRQRIAIARALYKRANILILDEATGQLDPQTEAGVLATIRAIGRDITLLVVAHRGSALTGCDRILELDAGRLVDPPGLPRRTGMPRKVS